VLWGRAEKRDVLLNAVDGNKLRRFDSAAAAGGACGFKVKMNVRRLRSLIQVERVFFWDLIEKRTVI
jgi:plasmid stability protein